MKKIIALMIAVMLTCALFTGCGSNSGSGTSEQTTPAAASSETKQESAAPEETADNSALPELPEKYKVGFVTLSVNGSFFGNVYGIVNEAMELTGSELVSDVGAISPEDQINSVNNVIAAGADMIIFINFTEECLPKIAQICDEAGVYWGQYARNVADPEIAATLDKSEHYVGRIYNDDSFIAKQALESFKENGVTKVGLVGPATGDPATDLRDSYFQEHAAEYGIEVIATVRDLTDAASATDAVSSILGTHPDCDGIYCISGSDSRAEGVMNAITNLGANGKVKVAMSDFFDGMEEYFDEGTIICSFGGSYPDAIFLTSLLFNQISGTPLRDKDKALVLELPYVQINDSAELAEYLKYCESGEDYAYNKEEIAEMIGYYNPDLTVDTLKEIMASYSLADVKARHTK